MEVILHAITSYSVINDNDFTLCKNRIWSESDRIRDVFVCKALELGKAKRVALFIQYHQSRILQLLDRVAEHFGDEQMAFRVTVEDRAEPVTLARHLVQQLERLLLYIEENFPDHFNVHLKSSKIHRYVVQCAIISRLPQLRYNFQLKGMDKSLVAVALYPLHCFVNTLQQEEGSYRKVMYLRKLLHVLGKQSTGLLTGERLNFRVCLVLCYLNYNSHQFFTYCTGAITRFIQAQPDFTKRIEKLAFILKEVRQVQVKPGCVYAPALPPVKDQLLNWIAAELSYLEKRQQLALRFPPHADEKIREDFKLKLDVSVSQLALFLKLLKEAGLIKNHNVLEVIRFVARVVQTKYADTLSSESLRSKYYNPEEGAREALLRMVRKALEWLNGGR